MAMSYTFAQSVAGSGISINVAYPGHAYTPMNAKLTVGEYRAAMRPLVPLVKLIMPLYGEGARRKASRSSVYLASSDEVEGVGGRYFNSHCKEVAWPDGVQDKHNRRAIWAECSRLAQHAFLPYPE
jgi:NAD(P)-dependent dehydrogenase (short-subunit alcohol dehydrogenase family)